MHVMYLDESGIASLTDRQSKNFILTGVIINDNDYAQISAYFNYIKIKNNLNVDIPFHAYDLFGNQGHSLYLSSNLVASNLAKSLAEFLDIIPIKIFCSSFKKEELIKFLTTEDVSYFKNSQEAWKDIDIGYEAVAAKLFLSFGKYLNQKANAVGKIITESRRESDIYILKSYLRCKNKDMFQTKRLIANSEIFEKKISGIGFENKKSLSCGLQIADLVSYIGLLSLERKLSRHQAREIPKIWNIIRTMLDKNKIHPMGMAEFRNIVSSERVNKITNNYKEYIEEKEDREEGGV